jgi:hypothetical protein
MIEQIELIKKQIEGLRAKKAELLEKQQVFLKVQGLDEELEKARVEIIDKQTTVEKLKEKLSDLKTQKANALEATFQALADKIGEVLPDGDAAFYIDEDGKLLIGWKRGELYIPYDGLSGAEKAVFDSALSHALLGEAENKILVIEAAELDKKRLSVELKKLNELDSQVIILTCHEPEGIPKGWNLIRL